MSDALVPAPLLEAVKRDLKPVRPLASPFKRTLALLPLAIALLFAAVMLWGWRANLHALPLWSSWGLSLLEIAVGLAIQFVAFREAEPGRSFGARTRAAIAVGGILVFVLVTFTTDALLPTTVRSEAVVSYLWECFGQAMVIALPAMIVPLWLMVRGLPERPALAGGLIGLGIGIMGDAGMRLYCWVTEPAHVLLAHGGAIALATLVGGIAAFIASAIKIRIEHLHLDHFVDR